MWLFLKQHPQIKYDWVANPIELKPELLQLLFFLDLNSFTGLQFQMIEWDDRYSVGISIIDEQHKKLFSIINKTIYSKEHSDDTEELKEVLEEMINYAQEHFETEEAYMIEFNYPEYEYHNEEHYDFITRTIAYFDRVVNGDYHMPNELLEYLKQWLVNHIQSTDRKYIDCFKKNGLI